MTERELELRNARQERYRLKKFGPPKEKPPLLPPEQEAERKKEMARLKQKRWRLNNPEKSRAASKKTTAIRKERNPEGFKAKAKKYAREYNQNRIKELTDDYVANIIAAKSNIDPRDIPPEMIETRRTIIMLKRALKGMADGGDNTGAGEESAQGCQPVTVPREETS